MDNLSSHKGPRVREMIEAAGATLLFLPPHSPDFSPIENSFAKLKARKAAERTVSDLWDTVGRIIDTYSPKKTSPQRGIFWQRRCSKAPRPSSSPPSPHSSVP
jgi:transposase